MGKEIEDKLANRISRALKSALCLCTIEHSPARAVLPFTVIKTAASALVAAALLAASPAFAGDKGCCAKNASARTACADLTSLNLTADQKTKIEAWQSECVKAGCTKESRKAFLAQAKGILSTEQFAKLKAQCGKSAKKTEA